MYSLWQYVSAALGILVVILGISLWVTLSSLDGVKKDLKQVETDKALLSIQKDALVSSISIQNDAISKLETSYRDNISKYNEYLKQTKDEYEKELEASRRGKPEEECKNLKEKVDEIITIINPTIIP